MRCLHAWLCVAALAAPTLESPPPLFYWRGDLLARSAALVQQRDPRVLPAYAALVSAADKALRFVPATVVSHFNKSLVPFPCNPREYVSVSFYSWPCTATPPGQTPRPDSSCNVTTGLPWRYWDGCISPFVSSFDLYIASDAINAVQTLALAYFFSGNEAYAAHAASVVRTFFLGDEGMLPQLDHAQFVPGVSTGSGTGCIDLDEYFATGFLDALALLRPSPSWTGDDEAGMQTWARAYIDWLLTSPNGQHESRTLNNHKAYFDAQILQLALYTSNATLAAERALTEGAAVLDVEIARGGVLYLEVTRTRSQHYVSFCLHAFLGLTAASGHAGVDLWSHTTRGNASSIAQAVEFTMPFANGSAVWPYENLDGWEWSWADLYDVYMVAAYALPARAQEFLTAAATTVNATAPNDLRRLLWPAPA